MAGRGRKQKMESHFIDIDEGQDYALIDYNAPKCVCKVHSHRIGKRILCPIHHKREMIGTVTAPIIERTLRLEAPAFLNEDQVIFMSRDIIENACNHSARANTVSDLDEARRRLHSFNTKRRDPLAHLRHQEYYENTLRKNGQLPPLPEPANVEEEKTRPSLWKRLKGFCKLSDNNILSRGIRIFRGKKVTPVEEESESEKSENSSGFVPTTFAEGIEKASRDYQHSFTACGPPPVWNQSEAELYEKEMSKKKELKSVRFRYRGSESKRSQFFQPSPWHSMGDCDENQNDEHSHSASTNRRNT